MTGAASRPAGRAADLGFAVLCATAAGLIAFEARKLPPSPFDPLGPGSVPMAVAALLAAMAALLLVRVALGLAIGQAAQSFVLGIGGDVDHRRRPTLAVASFLLTGAYVAAMDLRWLSFLPATFLYLAVLGAMLLPWRRKPQLIGIGMAVVGAIGLRWLFTSVLFVDLP